MVTQYTRDGAQLRTWSVYSIRRSRSGLKVRLRLSDVQRRTRFRLQSQRIDGDGPAAAGHQRQRYRDRQRRIHLCGRSQRGVQIEYTRRRRGELQFGSLFRSRRCRRRRRR